ncbi:hypothetical protein bcere0029_30780 [Bacillus cereus AH1272]|nr:hypothetical protein bcere0029_30780 [Bacillus cereus AH1272]EEL92923.1 hypothetical protein bcere0030_30350 [Bacillus cereus AH1273]
MYDNVSTYEPMYQEIKFIKEAVKKDLIFISDPFSFVT